MSIIAQLMNSSTAAVIASGAKQSRLFATDSGLPRFARNDVVMLTRYGG